MRQASSPSVYLEKRMHLTRRARHHKYAACTVEKKHSTLYWFILLFSASVGGTRRFLSWEAQQDETDRFKGFITAKPSAPAHAAACRRFGREGPSPIEKCLQNAATTVRLHAQPREQNSDIKRDANHFQVLNRANFKLWSLLLLTNPFLL